ncbi:MAG: hypothetical protein J6S67_15445 [Methanobrevibacter sp.]|nr:hypothetical protein [Methanobrevibacter sp.]
MATTIKEILDAAENVKPIGEVNGVKIMSFHDQNVAAQADLINGEADPGFAQMNPDGSIARSNYKYSAINVDALYENRFRKVVEKDAAGETKEKLQVVVDYRACKEQKNGRIYSKTIPAFVVCRKGKKLVVENTVLITDDEFIMDFKSKLNMDAMNEILPLIQNAVSDVSPVGLNI